MVQSHPSHSWLMSKSIYMTSTLGPIDIESGLDVQVVPSPVVVVDQGQMGAVLFDLSDDGNQPHLRGSELPVATRTQSSLRVAIYGGVPYTGMTMALHRTRLEFGNPNARLVVGNCRPP